MNKGKVFRFCEACGNIVAFKILNAVSVEKTAYCKHCRKHKEQNETKPYTNGYQ